ncbi:hypothetical protein ACW73L_18420 [Methylolobus aquaticus]
MNESSRSPGPSAGQVPSCEDVIRTFDKHLQYYSNSRGEQARVLRNAEASVKLQYAGRVAFELLQNGLDRAKEFIWVGLLDGGDDYGSLVVANDGSAVTLDPQFEYDHPPERQGRADLNALLSLHTSNKSPDQSMGNKGIGFRSVFSIGDRVEVWSRCRDEKSWWGVEMHWPARKKTWRTRANEYEPAKVATKRLHETTWEKIETLDEAEERASFTLPLPLLADGAPAVLIGADAPEFKANLVTAVIVPIHSKDVREDVKAHIDELMGSRLHFVGLRPARRGIKVQVTCGGQAARNHTLHTWPDEMEPGSWKVFHWKNPALADLAKAAEHEVTEPGVGLAWPPQSASTSHASDHEAQRYTCIETLMFNYLPTRIPSDFPVDVHGDFQVKADRTGMDLGGSPQGRYNKALIRTAAELHLRAVLAAVQMNDADAADWPWQSIHSCPTELVSSLSLREDLWELLTPRSGGSGAFVKELKSLLFDGDPRYLRWTKLARLFFAHQDVQGDDGRPELPMQVYRVFWNASAAWLERQCGCGSHTPTWNGQARLLCDALREAQVPCLPLADSCQLPPDLKLRAVPLPERRELGDNTPSKSRVFYRRTDEQKILLPEALIDYQRSITAYPLDPFCDPRFRPTGIVDFGRWDVLKELRQLPNELLNWEPKPLHEDEDEATYRQRQLIGLAAKLFTAKLGTLPPPSEKDEAGDYGLGWRANPSSQLSDDVCDAGRAIATLFLPMTDGLWAPARQLHRGEVDVDSLKLDHDQDLDVNAFLTFLGVAPTPPSDAPALLLIEGGFGGGRVEPLKLPPELCQPGSRASKLELALSPEAGENPQGLAMTLQATWSQGLSSLIEPESQDDAHQSRTVIGETLRALAWVPVGDDGWVTAPTKARSSKRFVPPTQVVTRPGNDRRAEVTYRVRNDSDDVTRQILEALGAVPVLNVEYLGARQGKAAGEILNTLRQTYQKPSDPELPPHLRRYVLDLAQETIGALVRHSVPLPEHPPLPVHEASTQALPLDARRVRWLVDPSAEAWIASDNSEQEIIRRFFPELPLASVTIGFKLIENNQSLKKRKIEVTERVKGGEKLPELDSHAEALATKIRGALPGLLALAHVSRLTTIIPNSEEILKSWGSAPAGPLIHVEDAYIEISLTGPSVYPKKHLEGADGHVLLLNAGKATSDEGGKAGASILFDLAENQPPPLADFGDALAEFLLNNRALGSIFARALGALDKGDEDWKRLLKREGADTLEVEYQAQLKPLNDEQINAFRQRLTEALKSAGAKLREANMEIRRLRRLGAEDLLPLNGDGWGEDVTARSIRDVLNEAAWETVERPFVPTLSVEQDNASAWQHWLDTNGWGRRLDAFALHHLREKEPDLTLQEMQERRQKWMEVHCFPQMKSLYGPTAAWAWLRAALPNLSDLDSGSIESTLRDFAPRYQPIKDLKDVSEAGWKVCSASYGQPSGVEREPASKEAYDEANAVKAAIGDEAESALLPFIAEQTHNCLKQFNKRGWEVLLDAVPERGKTRCALEQARSEWMISQDPECLKDALHVSRRWGNAGFDILGLEQGDQKDPVAVRYETKGLPDGAGIVCIHLSTNELRVATEFFRAKTANSGDQRYRGDWKLIGVEHDAKATDLTALIKDLIEQPDKMLKPLGDKGLVPDGFLLRVSRSSRLAP